MASSTVTNGRGASGEAGPLARLGDRVWHKSAPRAVRGDVLDPSTWEAWKSHLSRREPPLRLSRLAAGKTWPLLWGLPADFDPIAIERIETLAKASRKQRPAPPAATEVFERWINERLDTAPTPAFGLECVGAVYALPRLAAGLLPEFFWTGIDQLLGIARDAASLDVEEAPWSALLLRGELPLTLAKLFPEIEPCRKLAVAAGKFLSHWLIELTDGEGLLHARHVSQTRSLLAVWTRSLLVSGKGKGSCLSDDALVQYEHLVRQTLRLCRHDGGPCFGGEALRAADADLLLNALDQGGDEADRAASVTLPWRGVKRGGDGKLKSQAKPEKRAELPDTSFNSEWSALAALRCDWSAGSPRIFVDYSGRDVRLELDCGAGALFSGIWRASITCGGKKLEPTQDWAEICWHSDDDVDYLELENVLADGVRWQRQILLARADRIAYLADVLLGTEATEWRYEGRLPLAGTTQFEPATETREGHLVTDRKGALVLPLALPEWRVDPRCGNLSANEGALVLAQQAVGRAIHCPLFLDLKTSRLGKQTTWRQLTVAEQLKIQPADVAVGYRAQSGRRQWVIYRSLGPRGNRTLLGQNLSTEFLAARFDTDGDIESIVEIE